MQQISSKGVLLLLSLLGLGSAADFSQYNSRTCMNSNGIYCLTISDFSSGICCDPTVAGCSSSNEIYCVDAKNNNIKNVALRKFIHP